MTESTTATLIVMRSSSKCGACGNSADPDETRHYRAPGWGIRETGCGAQFTAITTDAATLDGRWRGALGAMRPDLPIVEYGETR
jgi:hypothetical protein